MKSCLLPLAVVAALMFGTPASGQYIFLDANGDGLNSQADRALPPDRLGPAVTSVDVYLVTDKNRDGSAAVCAQGPDPFSIVTYEITLHASGPGTVTYGAWTDNVGFSYGLVACGDGVACVVHEDAWIYKGTATALAPGKYKVGTLAISVTGSPVLDFMTGSPWMARAQTSFGSECLGSSFSNTLRLGDDFTDTDGTEATMAEWATNWSKIQGLYR